MKKSIKLPVSKTVAVPSVAVAKPAKVAAPAPAASAPAVAVERKAIPLSAKITVVATANPKRPGTKAAAKFPLYALAAKRPGGLTVANLVAEFLAAKYPKRRAFSALRWDSARGFIKIA